MSVWTAPIMAGSQTRPTITVKPTGKADVGAVALEYAGVSSVADASVVDRSASASGKTGSAAAVGVLRSDRPDHRRQRARARLLSRLRLRRHAHRRRRLHHAGQHLTGRRHRAARRGSRGRRRRRPQRHLRHRRGDLVARLHGRAQDRWGSAGAHRSGCSHAGESHGGQLQRHRHVDGSVQRQQRDHLLHGDAVSRIHAPDAHDGQRHPAPHDARPSGGSPTGAPTRSGSAPRTGSAPARRPNLPTRSRPRNRTKANGRPS